MYCVIAWLTERGVGIVRCTSNTLHPIQYIMREFEVRAFQAVSKIIILHNTLGICVR